MPPQATTSENPPQQNFFLKIFAHLFAQLIIAIVAGVTLGALAPDLDAALKPLGDGFIKLIKMLIAPLVFVLVATGIGRMNDLAKLGRIGGKTLLYFTSVTTLALLFGLLIANLLKPGEGFNIPPETLEHGTESISEKTDSQSLPGFSEFLLHIIPDSAVGAFADADILQVLLLAVFAGIALAKISEKKPEILIPRILGEVEEILFMVMGWIMRLAPVGAFGAMSYIIGQYGLGTLTGYAKLIAACYGAGALFVVILELISRFVAKISLWKFVKASKEEFGLALGTASTEAVMPRIMQKLVKAGNPESITGLVIPTGYSFNMDGATLYLSICMVFLAQATGADLPLGTQFGAVLILLLTSKGMAGVPGSSFLALSASATALGIFPVAAVAILLGVDRIMDSMRVFINLLGNCVATFIISRWEGELDEARYEEFVAQLR